MRHGFRSEVRFALIFAVAVLSLLPAYAAVDGTVINQTTGKPAKDATVTLYKLGQAGPEALQSVHTDAQGKFSIQQDAQGGPHNLQATYEGVTYAHVLRPGMPTTNVTLSVYDTSNKPGEAKVGQHFYILQPSQGQMVVSEVFLYKNEGKTAYNDPANGTLKFFLPAAAKGVVKVQAKGPNGMALDQLAQKTAKADVYKVDFPIKPGGDTQFEISYMVPYTSPGRFGSKDLVNSPEMMLVAPSGVELKGDGVTFARQEPRTQAGIYTVSKPGFEVEVTGQMAASEQGSGGGDSGGGGSSGPAIEQVMPKLFSQIDGQAGFFQKILAVKWILLLALGILTLGFILLYRQEPPAEAVVAAGVNVRDRKSAAESPKEKNERRRR